MKKLGTREPYNKPSFNLEEVVVEGGFTVSNENMTDQAEPRRKERRGFASMSPEKCFQRRHALLSASAAVCSPSGRYVETMSFTRSLICSSLLAYAASIKCSSLPRN